MRRKVASRSPKGASDRSVSDYLRKARAASLARSIQSTSTEEYHMRINVVTLLVLAIGASVGFPAARAQRWNAQPSAVPFTHKVLSYHPNNLTMTPEVTDLVRSQAAAAQTIPLWSYSVVAQDGQTYSGSMVGRSPFAHGHRTTTIPTYLVPVVLTFQDSGDVFDPTIFDGCAAANQSVIQLIRNSPLIIPQEFTMNGVTIGVGQYLDAFQRANFWSEVSGTPYHTTFSTDPTVLPPVNVTVPIQYGTTVSAWDFHGCMDVALMDMDWWDNEVQTVVIPALAAEGVGPANFPQFIFDSVGLYMNHDPSKCCALGYHGTYMNGGVFQTYSANEYDNSGAFGHDTSTMSHEIAEWMDDPDGQNPVPAWGAEGQVVTGQCQNNLEVGDPLSPGYPTTTNPFSITNSSTGVSYTLQELAFYSWFFSATPSLGAGGKYSNNGTFGGYAKPCPQGGTN